MSCLDHSTFENRTKTIKLNNIQKRTSEKIFTTRLYNKNIEFFHLKLFLQFATITELFTKESMNQNHSVSSNAQNFLEKQKYV